MAKTVGAIILEWLDSIARAAELVIVNYTGKDNISPRRVQTCAGLFTIDDSFDEPPHKRRGLRAASAGLFVVFLALIASLLASAAGAEPAVTFQNKWRNTYLAAQPSGPVLATQANTPDAQWLLERLDDGGTHFVRLKSAATGGYLNIEHGPLAIGPVEPGWYSAMWQFVRSPANDGSFRLQNRWKPDVYINAETGAVEAGPIQPGWVSANWAPQIATGASVAGGVGPMQQPAQGVEPSTQPAGTGGFPAGQAGTGGFPAGQQGQQQAQAQAPVQAPVPANLPPGVAQVTITNLQYPTIRVFHYDQQQNRTLFADVANGQTVKQGVDIGGQLRFATDTDWVGAPYTVGRQPSQTIVFQAGQIVLNGSAASERPAAAQQPAAAAPQHPAGSVPIVVASTATIRLAEMPKTVDGQSRALVDLAPGTSTTVWLAPGAELGAYDLGTKALAGQTYIVTSATQGQSIVVPYVRPGSVHVTMRNSTQSELSCQEVPDNGSAAIPLFSIAPGATVAQYLLPGKTLGFTAASNPSQWLGKDYKVTAAAEQSITLPIALGDLDASGTVSDAEAQQVAMKIALDVVQRIHAKENQPQSCWKNSYGRGVGTIPTTCNGNTEKNAGLCYTRCNAGYTSFVTMCVPSCPPGFRDDGLYCYKPGPVSRSAFPWKLGDTPFSLNDARARCAKSADGRRYGCVTANSNTIVYSNCPAGYTTAPMITSLCTPKCPANTTDIGISCQKHTYDRGVGKIPDCGGGTPQKDTGLCYKSCNPGYNGVGPVCWGSCPTGWVDCGAMCGSHKGACATSITYQATSVGMVALNVAAVAATAGGAAGATAAASAGKAAAETAAKAAAKAAARETARAALKAQVKAALATKGGAALAAIGKDLAFDSLISASFATVMPAYRTLANNRQIRDDIKQKVVGILAGDITDAQIDAVVGTAVENANARTSYADNFDYTMLDPTGVADVVMEFNLPMCSTIKP